MGGSAKLYFRVGLMVLGGIAAILGVAIWIGADRLRPAGQTFETYFSESVQGLDPGAAVRFRGVQVGRVESISLAFTDYAAAMRAISSEAPAARLVVVRFSVDASRIVVQQPGLQQDLVQAGLRVRMTSQGLTGVTYLEADFFDPARFPPMVVPWTPRYTVIPSVPSTLVQFQSQAEALLAELRAADLAGAIADLRGFVDALKEQFTTGEGYAALVAAADAMRSADAALRSVNGTVQSVGPAATQALDEMRSAAQSVQKLVDGPLGGEVTAAAASLRTGLARLPPALAAAESVLRRADSIAADAGRDIGPLLRDLRVSAENLRAMTEQMRQYPSRMLFGDPPPRQEDRR